MPERSYQGCCGRFHAGTASAPTAEALMRSRYSAFVAGDTDYLLLSWHSNTRPAELQLATEQEWSGLQVLDVVAGGMLDHRGEVEFIASYVLDGRLHQLRERSRFEREANRWVYLDGD